MDINDLNTDKISFYIDVLKDTFNLEAIPYQPVSPNTTIEKRKIFNTKAHSEFFLWLIKNHPDKLRLSGLDDYDLITLEAHIKQGNGYYIPKILAYRNVDHIISLYLGGSNEPENLTFIPSWINDFKCQIERRQINKNPNLEVIWTLLPKKDQRGYDPLPIIPEHLHTKPDRNNLRQPVLVSG